MEHSLVKTLNKSKVKFPEILKPNSDFKNEFIENLEDTIYHSMTDKMSSSGVRKIIKSPRNFVCWMLGIDPDAEEERDNDALRFGRAAHLMILEPKKFRERFIIQPDFGPMQSSKNRAKRDEWVAEQDPNAVIMKESEYEHLLWMIDSLTTNESVRALLANGQFEVTGIYKDPKYNIACKNRYDILNKNSSSGGIILTDLKTTTDVDKGLFSNTILKLKYHIQMAFYARGIEAITGAPPEESGFIAIQKKPPYECAVHYCDEEMMEIGMQWVDFALLTYLECCEKTQWPSAQKNAGYISLPNRHKFDEFPQFIFE